jgi:hypothetical protein
MFILNLYLNLNLYAYIVFVCASMVDYRDHHSTMIDRDYTDNMRDVIDTGFDYTGPIFTEAEIDHLLYGEDGVNENFTTKLAEEGIYRSHGLRVDLAMQGSAVNNVVRIDESQMKDQPNNVYTVALAESNKRKFQIDDQNYSIRHKVTQEDANVAVKSIDFPGRKVHATPLDLMTFDSGSNPIENKMIDQLTVCQALEVMGADTSDLIAHVNTSFRITYAAELVRNACLAPIGDIGKYIATGGRPTACLAISPNMVSRFSIVSRPNVTPEDAGVPSIFFQRCSQNVKLIILVTNMSRGFGACKYISFAANPGQFGRVTSTTMAGLKFETDIVGKTNSISASLNLPSTAAEFLRHRQAAKTSISVAKRQVQRNVEHFMKIADVRSASVYSDPVNANRSEIMSYQVPDPRQAIPTTSSASNVSSMLFSAFHTEDGHKWFMPASEMCFVMLIAHHVCVQVNEVGTLYSNVSNVAGIKAMLGQINIAKVAASDAGCAEIFANAPDKSKICSLYLFCRHVTLSKENYERAKETVRRVIAKDRTQGEQRSTSARRGKRVQKSGSRDKIMLGPYYRYARMVNKVLSKMHQGPCSHMDRLGAIMSHGFTIRSIFDDNMAQALIIIRKENTEPDARNNRGFMTLKILTSRIRVQWSNYYNAYAQELVKIATCMPVMTTGGEKSSAEFLKSAEFNSKASSPVFASIAVEALAATGKALAYKFFYVGYRASEAEGSNAHESTKISYSTFLTEHSGLRAGDIVEKHMSVDSKMDQLQRTESAINTALNKSVKHFVGSCNGLGFKDEDVRAAIIDSYKGCEYTLKHSLTDMIKQDIIYVNGDVASSELPNAVMEKGPTKLTAIEADTIAVKFCDSTLPACPGAAQFGIFATRKTFSAGDAAFLNLKLHLESVAISIGNQNLALSTAMLNLSDNMIKDSKAHMIIIVRSREIKELSSFTVADDCLNGYEFMYNALSEDVYRARSELDTNYQNIMV